MSNVVHMRTALTLTAGQQRAMAMIDSVAEAGYEQVPFAIVAGYAGCHRRGQPILRADGSSVAAEAVVVGDRLAGFGAGHRTVLSLAAGRSQMVEVQPTKGDKFVVNIDHILTIYQGAPYRAAIIDVGIREFMSWPPTRRTACKLMRSDAIEFDVNSDPIRLDPYFIGVLLGDGSIQDGVGISKPNPEMRELAEEQAGIFGLHVTPAGEGTSVTWRICGTKGVANPISDRLRELGLFGTTSANKFIPDRYKRSTISNRMLVLAGLLDTDGSINGSGFDFVSQSERLARDLEFVARSLGFAAYTNPCQKSDQNGVFGEYWRVFVSGDCDRIPTRMKRAPPRKQKKSVLRTGFELRVLDGEEDYFGFSLDGDGRFLLGDFTATHNTGKTTLLKLCAHLNPLQLAPTGKAALRLTEATGRGSQTIHRAIYSVRELKNGEVEFDPKGVVPPENCRVILVDEASMIGERVWSDLLSAAKMFKLPVVAIGDPFQLPPVTPGEKNPFSVMALDAPDHVELTEVLRQALDSPIIAASMKIRQGDVDGGLSLLEVIGRNHVVGEAVRIFRGGGTSIVGRNATRFWMNRKIREVLWAESPAFAVLGGTVGAMPRAGEPMLVTKNNYRVGLFNGEVVPFEGWRVRPEDFKIGTRTYKIGVVRVGSQFAWLAVAGLHGDIDKQAEYDIEKFMDGEIARDVSPRPLSVLRANLGYALTAHKAQGSEWDEVLVGIEASVDLDTVEGRRWGYTALTRAKRRCVVAWGAGANVRGHQ